MIKKKYKKKHKQKNTKLKNKQTKQLFCDLGLSISLESWAFWREDTLLTTANPSTNDIKHNTANDNCHKTHTKNRLFV